MKIDHSIVRALLTKRFTFMLVPNGAGKTRQINIHFSVLALFMVAWTAVTFWGSYLSAQHIDYWRTELSNHVLHMKVKYLLSQIDETRGFLDEVKQVEASMRDLLKINSEVAKKDVPVVSPAADATGGPTADDQNQLLSLLSNANNDVTWKMIFSKVHSMQDEAENRLESYGTLSAFIKKERSKFLSTPIGWPCPGARTSHFGRRQDPFSGSEEFHSGVDIAVPTGTKIKATADGIVRIAGWQSGYGYLVVIEHGYGFSTRYGHNSMLSVKPGQRVKRGQVIALSGQTGRASGPHCHYEVWQNNIRKNPSTYMQGDSSNVNAISRLPEEKFITVVK